jgi:hypothetical protein
MWKPADLLEHFQPSHLGKDKVQEHQVESLVTPDAGQRPGPGGLGSDLKSR